MVTDASIASQLIGDSNRALLHNGYGVQLFHDAAGSPKLGRADGQHSPMPDHTAPARCATCSGCLFTYAKAWVIP